MMLTVLLFLCSITVIAPVPVPATEDVICETILTAADYLSSAREAMSCRQTQIQDCEQVEKEDCRILSQKLLQPCLINLDKDCSELRIIESLHKTPECPNVANICQALHHNQKSLVDTTSLVCPETDPIPRTYYFIFARLLRTWILLSYPSQMRNNA